MSWLTSKVDKHIEVTDKKIGCCESNNILAQNCDTEYIMHIDDDIYFTQPLTITRMMKHLNSKIYNCDIVSCLWKDMYYGRYREASVKHIKGWVNGEKVFWKISVPREIYDGFHINVAESDEALHTVILPMKVYNDVAWDEHYQWKGDREDFFLQVKEAGYKIHTMLDVEVTHDPKPFPYGSLSYGFDGAQAKQYFREKWHMEPLFGWDGPQDKPK